MKATKKIQQQYISQIRILFPIIGKRERRYLKKIRSLISSYCDETSIVSLESLYKEFGVPSDIVNEYYSDMDITDTVNRIRRNLIMKKSFCYGMIILLAILITYCIGVGIIYKTRKDISTNMIYNSYEEYIESLEGESIE